MTYQAGLEWHTPMNPWEPIHVRVDDSTEWYEAQLERGDYIRDTEKDAEMHHRKDGYVAEGLVKAVFPAMDWWDTNSFDLFLGGRRYDIISRSLNRGEPRQHYVHKIQLKKEEREKPSTHYYAVVRSHPDYWLIGHINSIRFWYLCDRSTPEFWDDDKFEGGYLSYEHFKQLPIPDPITPPPAIEVFGQG